MIEILKCIIYLFFVGGFCFAVVWVLAVAVWKFIEELDKNM